MATPAEILNRDYSDEFDELRKNRIVQSHYKYGWMSDNYPHIADAVKCLEERLELYKKDGNKEWLVDVANFAMIEFKCPKHPNAHFEATSSEKSPGLVGGSYKQMLEEIGEW